VIEPIDDWWWLSFNPYFTGSTTSTINLTLPYGLYKEFQSLFYWKYHFNNQIRARVRKDEMVSILILLEVPLQQAGGLKGGRQMSGFNPYFTGSTTSTCTYLTVAGNKWLFQSLFYWKYHFNQLKG